MTKSEDSRRTVGRWLVGIGLLLVVAGFPLWSHATEQHEKDALAGKFATFEDMVDPPNRVPAFAAWGAGALAILSGVVLFASPGAVKLSGVAGDLDAIARQHRDGDLTDAEYEQAKRRVLGEADP